MTTTTIQRQRASQTVLERRSMPSPVGELGLVCSEQGLVEVRWLGRSRWQRLTSRSKAHPHLHAARHAIRSYFDGGGLTDMPPLDLRELCGFRRLVSETLMERVPFGETISYGDLALLCDHAGAARAVGTVMSKNPLPLFVPCHRVLSKSGLGGFGPGLDVKRHLLRLEGAEFRN